MIIGLTGGIATGKSTVSRMLRDRGALVIDADKIAHQIMEKGNRGWKKVKEEFGNKILTDDREINRELLGELVFSNEDKLKKLEEITHPLIIEKINKVISKEKNNRKHIFLEAPLLYESGLDRICDEVWVVYTNKRLQMERLMKRDNISSEKAEKIIKSQMNLKEKKKRADRLINNNKDIKNLKKQVTYIWNKINGQHD